ncbi:MAG: Stk1 family PASTA domain-containing Ser/Thr kinase [Lachnospiraceae bacterium]|jgi:serine/threonine protein kinase/beta-lactam-binding protein with PASTA domain|nr:Stk1 family PASTA domain-containing Ser/Thr kinase [Lachnospiraceae bacterium]
MIRLGMFLGDRYEILEKIGSGGMAEVFKGKDHKLNRFVAVKVLKDEFVEDKNFVRKFKEEAQAAAGLAHPNIVNVYDVGDEQNINYIVMELVEGITLKTYIEKKGRLTVKEATSIAIQMGGGLELAHNNQIVHRDIKPQNIMISREGKVKVTDFGIAKSVSANTNTSDAMGSVHYTSPEQARGGYSDAKSDIYSMGIVMYEMVTGRVPFDGETTVVVAVKHLQEDIVSPRVYASDIPVSLEHIILKCTEKSPDRRYASVAELTADLKQSLVTPDVNFVKEILPDGAKTVAITRDDLSRIKQETGRIPLPRKSRHGYPEDFGEDDEELFDDDYDDDEGYDDYDDDDYDDDYDDDDYDDEEDDDDDGGILDPKLEKIMTIGGIAAAVIIVIIIFFIIGKIFIFGKTGKKPKEDKEPQIEDVLDGDEEEEEQEVPNLLGKSYSEAKEALNTLSLGIRLGETRSSSEYEPGQIIAQSVDAGTKVEANTTIIVDICGDGEEMAVPNVVGQSLDQAVRDLEEKGFTVDVAEAFDDNVSKGNVISTTPKGESKASRGSLVRLVVSKGPEEDEEVSVPKIEGLTEAEAKDALKSAGLKSGTAKSVFSDNVEEGRIVSQSVRNGTKVPKDTAISYEVSKGKENKDVYIGNAEKDGSSESAVTNYFINRGLKVSRSEEYHDSVPKGNVISYSPGNGNTVPLGSTVTIVVSLGPEPVITVNVPALSGMTAEQAKNAISGIDGLSWGGASNGDIAPDYTKNGQVYWQSHSGTQNKGTTVSVRVYADVPNCGDGNHNAPAGSQEGASVKCTKCGADFTIPVTPRQNETQDSTAE